MKQVEEARAVRGDKVLEEGAAEINELIRKEVARIKREYTGREGQVEYDISKLNMEEEMGKMDSRLLKFFDRATLNQSAVHSLKRKAKFSYLKASKGKATLGKSQESSTMQPGNGCSEPSSQSAC